MNVTLTDEGYTLDGKWRLVPVEPTYEMAILSLNGGLDYKLGVKAAPPPPAELAISGEPYAIECGISNGDGTYSVEIERHPLPPYKQPHKDHAVKLLYLHPEQPPPQQSPGPDCRTCANRGMVNGLSQETYCDGCVWHGAYWEKNHYKPLPEPAP